MARARVPEACHAVSSYQDDPVSLWNDLLEETTPKASQSGNYTDWYGVNIRAALSNLNQINYAIINQIRRKTQHSGMRSYLDTIINTLHEILKNL